jgi:hypothetical protein
MKAKISPFYLVVIDDDRKLFNVIGPMVDDTSWTNRVARAQDEGLNVRCQSSPSAPPRTLSLWDVQYQATDESLLSPPPDSSASYNGSLPGYASSADRERVVKVFCRQCRATRWAEMATRYPGADALKNAQVGDYEARCLRCDSVAVDAYKWGR